MIRIFNVYYPVRTLVLLAGEGLVVWTSFALATILRYQQDTYIVLNFEYGYYKILVISALALLCAYFFDLYDLVRCSSKNELYFRVLLVPGLLAFVLAGLVYLYPPFLMGNHTFVCGLVILAMALVGWRFMYGWLMRQPYLRERVYILGAGEPAQRLLCGLKSRPDLGIEVMGCTETLKGLATREALAEHLKAVSQQQRVHRVIVAMPDRRGTLPVQELLQLRVSGARVEDATSWLERLYGKIDVEQLYPSWLIFAQGFRSSAAFMFSRRVLFSLAALACLLITLPILPLVALGIKITSPGPVLYRQRRVGYKGRVFYCYKFRTMCADAEADTGPTWAGDDDPRITWVGHFLRMARLDELPQLWNVLRGDMGFVGPRPERPEFVEWLTQKIPYYTVRHVIQPGITGWAQIKYGYGNTVEDAREKLQYDLYYIKNLSLGLDLMIMLQTVKIVVLGRGAK